jgi:hypothetical protein
LTKPADKKNHPRGGVHMKKLVLLAFAFLVFGSLSFGADKIVVGVVSDSHCGMKHAEAGNEHCVEHCVSGGASYVLVSEGKVYQLDAQDKFKGLGGKSVRVTGDVKDDNIRVRGVEEKKS